MTRYRPARIVPGVNPPAAIESLETIRTTGGPAAGAGKESDAALTVAVSDRAGAGAPHEPQKRCMSGISESHVAQRISVRAAG